ncbi:hypothetical protein [Microbispora sp. NBRC 16548]|uniref:hypothetical protein n=1 Tax=Microbispora sp. NBRC 16548 TaxID=3030994 RepID=UPI0024A216A4|nr:hypothetical protein [Microbispora sp. NBRC 16548]GLX06688.1 hypothetical protein Misp03_36150 [Microbispora sp. NBRC 16548]
MDVSRVYNCYMQSSEYPRHDVEGDLRDAVTSIASDGLFAQPVLLDAGNGTTAVVISHELFALLQQAMDGAAAEAAPPATEQLAMELGMTTDDQGNLVVSDG